MAFWNLTCFANFYLLLTFILHYTKSKINLQLNAFKYVILKVA